MNGDQTNYQCNLSLCVFYAQVVLWPYWNLEPFIIFSDFIQYLKDVWDFFLICQKGCFLKMHYFANGMIEDLESWDVGHICVYLNIRMKLKEK